MVWCGRIDQGSIRVNHGGQYLHRLSDGPQYVRHVTTPHIQKRRKKKPQEYWSKFAQSLARNTGKARDSLADKLSVSPKALTDLNVGWHPHKRYWSFPERDGGGKTIGINARYVDGSKKRLFGSSAGLTYADIWDAADGPILLVEGGSDTAAAMTIGLNVVGRPSNNGGVNLLADLLVETPIDREIVVIGERDQKVNGRWPGREGAVSTAKQLAETLERPIVWALPPDDAKDARVWLRGMPSLPSDRLAALFVSGLETTVIEPPITVRVTQKSGPARGVDDWRETMLQARIRSLGKPGYYLDASTTGAGKTHVDYNALMFAFGREEAA